MLLASAHRLPEATQSNDAKDLVTLARNEKDVKMKQYLVQQLSLMHNQEATKYMLEILNK